MRSNFHVTDFVCATCGAKVGSVCRSKKTGKVVPFHFPRIVKAAEEVAEAAKVALDEGLK